MNLVHLGAEPRSFRCLSESGNGYWCDRQRVYFEGQVLENAKPDFFSVMNLQNQSIFGHCQGVLYVGANCIPEVDLATFHFLVDHWLFAKDKSNVYAIYDNKLRVIDVDVSSFKIFEGGIIVRDNLRAFVVISGAVLKIIPDADLHTLTLLDCGYVKDKYRVYYHDVGLDDQILISSADPASFVVTDYESTISDSLNVDAKDKFGHYYRGILLRNTLIEDE
nr:DKNYY domain-containing protein [Motilimonas sp. E26]